jgi:putative peptidoglycan lipid II flippase
MEEKKRVAKAAGLMSIATFISRMLGYTKDMILAAFFGATGLSDAFFIAFRIPNLLRELFAEGSMSTALVPVITEYQAKQGEEETKKLVRIVFTFIVFFVGLVCTLGIILAPAITSVIAPGFINMPEKFSITVLLTRIMFPFLLFVSLAALVMGVLNTKRVFFIPAFAPAMLNIVTIVAVIVLVYRIEQPIVAAAIGIVLGGFVQFAFQLPSFFKNGYSLRPEYDFRYPGLKKMLLLILPATMGMAVAQINIFISTILASYLPAGSVTYLYYSMRLIHVPIGVFGVAIAVAVLPTLSKHAVKGEFAALRDDFSFALRLLFFITIPAMAGLIALGEPIVNTLFQRGQFDYTATQETARALFFYSLGLWAMAGTRVVTVSFYSMQDTKTPVKVAVISLTTNIILSFVLLEPMKHAGLAFANAVASIVNFSILFYLLRAKLKRIDGKKIMSSFIKVSIVSFIMGVIGWLAVSQFIWSESGSTINKAAVLVGIMILCISVYIAAMHILKNDELNYIVKMIKEKKSRVQNSNGEGELQ